MEAGTPACNCEEVIDEIYSSKLDLTDSPLQNPDLELLTEESSSIQDRQRKLHTAYRSQSAGKVESMNRTLKTTLANSCQETQLSCFDMLPLALLQAQYTLRSLGYSPFEILYGRTPPVIGKLMGNPHRLAALEMSQHPQALGKVLHYITRETLERTPILWAIGFTPISQEMRYRLKIRKKRTTSASLDRPLHGRSGNSNCY